MPYHQTHTGAYCRRIQGSRIASLIIDPIFIADQDASVVSIRAIIASVRLPEFQFHHCQCVKHLSSDFLFSPVAGTLRETGWALGGLMQDADLRFAW